MLPELSRIFGVSVDTILSIDSPHTSISVQGMAGVEISILLLIANRFRINKKR